MKKLLTLSLALLLCLTACEPKENHEVESEFEPETVVETEAEAEAETETETKPKRTPEEKISSPFKGMTDEEVISFFENVLGPNGADVMIFIDCPSPSPDLEKAWEAMEFEERKEAKKELEILRKNYPQNVEYAICLANIYLKDKEYLKTRKVLKDFIKQNPDEKGNPRFDAYGFLKIGL